MCLITIKSWFCGCCDLRVGTLVIAILNLIGSVGGTLVSIFLLAAAETIAEGVAEASNATGVEADEIKDYFSIFFYVIGGMFLLSSVFFIILSSLLFHGAKKGKPSMIFPWMILMLISIFSLTIGFLWACSESDLHGYGFNASYIIIISTLIGIAVEVYIYIGISSYWRELTYGGSPPPSFGDTFKSSGV